MRTCSRVLVLGFILIGMLMPSVQSGWARGSSGLPVDDHLLLCEAVATPTPDEFIEIHNATGSAVALDNYYLSDDEDYALLPGASGDGPAPNIGSFDFIAQFPSGASIPANGVLVIAFDGAGFSTTFGFNADFEIHGTDAGTPDMLSTDVGGSAGLTNSGESAVLFLWDGATDLVSDVDMVNIGTPSSTNDIGNKTGLSVDGPDGGVITTTYLTDAGTIPLQSGDPGAGFSTKRISQEAGNEISTGGNGLTGNDETTENILFTWDSVFTAPDPGQCLGNSAPKLHITEIMYNPASSEDNWEWVEIYNAGPVNLNLAGYVFDDNNGTAHGSANIAAGTLNVGTSAILYNADDVSSVNFEAAWGPGINLIAVTNW